MKKSGMWGSALLLWASAAVADDSVLLAKHGDWSAFTTPDGSVCWAATLPMARQVPDGKRGLPVSGGVYLMVSFSSGAKPEYEMSYTWGAAFPPGAEITLQTALADFVLFEDKGWAWIDKDDRREMSIVALRQADVLGRELAVVTLAGPDGARDVFSAAGLQDALDEIARHCR